MTSDRTNPFEIGQLSQEVLAAADEAQARQLEELAQVEKAAQEKLLRRLARQLWEARGVRYQNCTLTNFRAATPQQQEVLAAIKRYAANIPAWIDEGVNILLNGQPGTGKDHLLAALMHIALAKGRSVRWTSGTVLFRRFRDRIDHSEASEYELLRNYVWPQVLVISDPARKDRVLSDYQQDTLYAILDVRYNHQRPVWVTLNAKDGAEANRLIGADNVDRLRDGGLSRSCNWESYRKAME